MNEINDNIDFWIKNNLNVLFRGKHGVGKTSIVINAFNRHKLKWKYFSASTLDPWVDFVGVPKEMTDKEGNTYLDLVRPREFAADEVEAIMIDEYNRGAKKVKNAVMELLQFRSINGKKFKNLKLIWAAINPDDDEDNVYDVEKMDPAQLDRFHIHVDVPYQPEVIYFSDRYGPETGEAVCEWWNKQDDKIKKAVSPRRLDYALDIHVKGGSLRQVLPSSVNLTELMSHIKCGAYLNRLKKLLADCAENPRNEKKLAEFVNDENNFKNTAPIFERHPEYIDKVLPHLDPEKIALLLSKGDNIVNRVYGLIETIPSLKNVVTSVKEANANEALINRLNGNQLLADAGLTNFTDYHFAAKGNETTLKELFSDELWDKEVGTFKIFDNTSRTIFADKLINNLPYDIPKDKVYPLLCAAAHVAIKNQPGSDPLKFAKTYNYLVFLSGKHKLNIDGFKETHKDVQKALPGVLDTDRKLAPFWGKPDFNMLNTRREIEKRESHINVGMSGIFTGIVSTGKIWNAAKP